MDAETFNIVATVNLVVPPLTAAGYSAEQATAGLLFTAFTLAHGHPGPDAPAATQAAWTLAAAIWVARAKTALATFRTDGGLADWPAPTASVH